MTASSILLPSAFAGVVAIGVTLAIERWGGRIGGLLGTLPTTIVPASVGIAVANAHSGAFTAAMCTVPAGMLVNALFLWSWRALPPRLPPWPVGSRLAAMTGASLAIWFGLATGAVALMNAVGLGTRAAIAVGVGATVAIVAIGGLACLVATPTPRGRRPVGVGTLALRGLLAAGAIGASVAIAGAGSPLAAGIASVFPAIFLTTMVSLWFAQGEAVPAGAVGPMMLGSAAVATYALAAAAAFPAFGPALGAVVAWATAVATTTVPAWAWLGRRERAQARSADDGPAPRGDRLSPRSLAGGPPTPPPAP